MIVIIVPPVCTDASYLANFLPSVQDQVTGGKAQSGWLRGIWGEGWRRTGCLEASGKLL